MDQDSTVTKIVPQMVPQTKDPQILTLDDEHKFVTLPPGWTAKDLKDWMPDPNRIIQCVHMLDEKSFCEYVNAFGKDDTTRLFANEQEAQYLAILDYHTTGLEKGFNAHRAMYLCPKSEEWKLWTTFNGKAMNQGAFAVFIEDNLRDIANPPGAAMLEMAIKFEAHKSAKFVSDMRLDNGQRQLVYKEELQAQSGQMSIPTQFTLKIPIFLNGKRIEIPCRFRYRLDGGALSIWYEIERKDSVYGQAVAAVTAGIREKVKFPLHVAALP
jgi:uncharacterized protein YfdQ (DUF2303 family)